MTVINLVAQALARSVLRFSFSVGSPPVFDSRSFPLSDEVIFCLRRDARIIGVRIIVPGVLEVDWSPPPNDARKLPYSLNGGETFRIRGVRSALEKQLPALMKEKAEALAQKSETGIVNKADAAAGENHGDEKAQG